MGLEPSNMKKNLAWVQVIHLLTCQNITWKKEQYLYLDQTRKLLCSLELQADHKVPLMGEDTKEQN